MALRNILEPIVAAAFAFGALHASASGEDTSIKGPPPPGWHGEGVVKTPNSSIPEVGRERPRAHQYANLRAGLSAESEWRAGQSGTGKRELRGTRRRTETAGLRLARAALSAPNGRRRAPRSRTRRQLGYRGLLARLISRPCRAARRCRCRNHSRPWAPGSHRPRNIPLSRRTNRPQCRACRT